MCRQSFRQTVLGIEQLGVIGIRSFQMGCSPVSDRQKFSTEVLSPLFLNSRIPHAERRSRRGSYSARSHRRWPERDGALRVLHIETYEEILRSTYSDNALLFYRIGRHRPSERAASKTASSLWRLHRASELMATIPNQSSVAKAYQEFDADGRMTPSPYCDRVGCL